MDEVVGSMGSVAVVADPMAWEAVAAGPMD